MILGARARACPVTVRSLRDSPKKPHAAPPAGILSVWQIKENPVGNDLLIIVNGLISCPPFADRGAIAIVWTTMRPGWGRVGDSHGFAADKRSGWRIPRRAGRTMPPQDRGSRRRSPSQNRRPVVPLWPKSPISTPQVLRAPSRARSVPPLWRRPSITAFPRLRRNAGALAPVRRATSISTRLGARRSANRRPWNRICSISLSRCGRIRGFRAKSRCATTLMGWS